MCMPELSELLTEMGKLYFNKYDSLQEKRQHIYIRSAMHSVYLTSTFLASRWYPAINTLVTVVGTPFWSQSAETQQQVSVKRGRTPWATVLLKGGGLGLRDLYCFLPVGDTQCGFSTSLAYQVAFAWEWLWGFCSGSSTLAAWQTWAPASDVIAMFSLPAIVL